MTISMAAYVAAMFVLGRCCGAATRQAVDVVMINWLVLSIIWAVGRAVIVPVWLAVDFACGLYLVARGRSRVAIVTGLLFAPMLIWHFAALIGHVWPDAVINVLGWVQMLALLGGAWGDGLGEVAGRFGAGLGRHGGGRSAAVDRRHAAAAVFQKGQA